MRYRGQKGQMGQKGKTCLCENVVPKSQLCENINSKWTEGTKPIFAAQIANAKSNRNSSEDNHTKIKPNIVAQIANAKF